MSLLCDGTHKTVLEGSIYPGPLIRLVIAYETTSPYGPPVHIQKVFEKPPEPLRKPMIPMGDEHRHAMFSNLHKLLSGEQSLIENRKLLTDRPSR